MTHYNISTRTGATQNPAPMRWLYNAVILAALFIVLGGSLAAQVKKIRIDDGVVSKIDLSDGSTVTVETDQPFGDILIGNTDVLDVFPLTGSSLYLQGKRSGSTNVTLYSDDKRLLEVIEVRVRIDYSDLSKALR